MTKAEKFMQDAPCHYNASEASAWAAGYNACLDAQPQSPPCSNCSGTKRGLYFSEQAWCHEERDCHLCAHTRPVRPSET